MARRVKEDENPAHRVVGSGGGGHVRKPITINFRQPSSEGAGDWENSGEEWRAPTLRIEF